MRPAADLLARLVLSFGFRPPPWFDANDPAAVRRLVHTYVLPAITPPTGPRPRGPSSEVTPS